MAKIILTILLIILITLIILANHLVSKACLRKNYMVNDLVKINAEGKISKKDKQKTEGNREKLVELEDYYFDTMRDWSIKSFDNLNLFGKFL